jgi:hypothetical protein
MSSNNKHLFERVPTQLFHEIREFLIEKEYFILITVANNFFRDVKHETWQVYLDSNECKLFLEDEAFRRKVLDLIKEPHHQLNLVSNQSFSLTNFDKLISFPSRSIDLSSTSLHEIDRWSEKVCNKQSVTLRGNNSMEVFTLDPNNTKLKSLRLSLFGKLKQVSFARLQELKLEHCYELVDVNYLRNLSSLTIKSCHKVTDISQLGRVHSLYIENCRGIEDISGLTDNNSVKIYSCINIRTKTIRFTNVPCLSLDMLETEADSQLLADEAVALKNLSLTNYSSNKLHLSSLLVSLNLSLTQHTLLNASLLFLQEVTMNYCKALEDISPLRKVPMVRLGYCSFQTLHGLGENLYVRVEGCKILKDFSALRDVPRVEIIDCRWLENGQELMNVENLSLRQCHEIEDLSMLTKLKYVFLRDCWQINEKVLSLSSLVTVEVLSCRKICSFGALFQESGCNIMKVALNLGFKLTIEKMNEENNHLYHLEERNKLTNLYPMPVVILLRN